MICGTCQRDTTTKEYEFWCIKREDIHPGTAPVYRFAVPICDACVQARYLRRKQIFLRFLTVGFPGLAVAGLVVGVFYFSHYEHEPLSKSIGGALALLMLLSIPVGFLCVVLAAVLLSSLRIGTELAVKACFDNLTANGFVGFWPKPPKYLTVRPGGQLGP